MEADTKSKALLLKLAQIIPGWFAVLAALTYACGFVCVYSFMDRFGLRESTTDFLKAKYVHAGILFFLFPGGIVLPLLVLLILKAIGDNSKAAEGESSKTVSPPVVIYLPTVVLFLNMLLVFYVCVMFMPRNYLHTHQLLLMLIVASGLVAPALIMHVAKHWIKEKKEQTFGNNARWCVALIVVFVLDYYAFRGSFPELKHIVWGTSGAPSGAIYYYLFVGLIAFVVWRIRLRSKNLATFREKCLLWAAGISVSLVLLFFAALAFAARVYPFIPVAKGGGDLSQSPCITVEFSPRMLEGKTNLVGDPLFLALTRSNCFVIIEQTVTSLYLANTNEKGGPLSWREGTNYPRIVELRRMVVDRIVYEQPALH